MLEMRVVTMVALAEVVAEQEMPASLQVRALEVRVELAEVVQAMLVVERHLLMELLLGVVKAVPEVLLQLLLMLQQAQRTPQFRLMRSLQKNSQSQRLMQTMNQILLGNLLMRLLKLVALITLSQAHH